MSFSDRTDDFEARRREEIRSAYERAAMRDAARRREEELRRPLSRYDWPTKPEEPPKNNSNPPSKGYGGYGS